LKHKLSASTKRAERLTYLSCGDHDANLFDCFGKLIRFDSAIVVKIKVLEALQEDLLFALVASCLLGQLFDKFLFKTKCTKS
jgi:hypothetical protein